MQKLLSYFKHLFRFDLIAGLTVAMIAIPQSMAYATIAGLQPINGLYAAMLPAVIAALFGSSRYLVTGATNAIALTTTSVLLAFVGDSAYAQYAFFLAIASGLIILLLGLLNLGGMIRFVSNSVLTAFLAGAGLLILINQAGGLVGIERPLGSSPLATIQNLFLNLDSINFYVMAVSGLSLLILIGLKRINSKIPAAFVAMAICGGLVWGLDWHAQGVKIVADISEPMSGMFQFAIPDVPLSEAPHLLISAFAIAILSLVQTISVAKPLAVSRNEKLVPNRDFMAQGAASIVSGLVGGMPSAGSLAQSAVNVDAGARTRAAAAISGMFVFGVTILFSDVIYQIPTACLSAIVIVSAFRLIDFGHIERTWKTNVSTRLVLVVTFVATILMPLQYAIFIGTGMSIFVYLMRSKNLKISGLKIRDDGAILDVPLADFYEDLPSDVILNIEGSLYFGSVEALENEVERLLGMGELRSVVFYMRATHSLASTMANSFKSVLKILQSNGVEVFLCGLSEESFSVLKMNGLLDVMDEEHVVLGSEVIFESLHEVIEKTETI